MGLLGARRFLLKGQPPGGGEEGKRGRKDQESEELCVNINGGRVEREGRSLEWKGVRPIGGEPDGEGGKVNEVTYPLISNEVRLRVFNENV